MDGLVWRVGMIKAEEKIKSIEANGETANSRCSTAVWVVDHDSWHQGVLVFFRPLQSLPLPSPLWLPAQVKLTLGQEWVGAHQAVGALGRGGGINAYRGWVAGKDKLVWRSKEESRHITEIKLYSASMRPMCETSFMPRVMKKLHNHIILLLNLKQKIQGSPRCSQR